MDFKEFLPDNAALIQRLQDLGQAGHPLSTYAHTVASSSRLREVQDPLTWASCFLAFMAARVDHGEARELAAYGQIILHLARKHGGSGWIMYDKQFRQQRAAGALFPWTDINPSLMAATVFGPSGDRHDRTCSLCLAPDHSKEECALAALEPVKPARQQQTPAAKSLPTGRSVQRFTPYIPPDNRCRKYNRGECMSATCKYEHTCTACNKPGHGAFRCLEAKGKSKASLGDPKPTMRPFSQA